MNMEDHLSFSTFSPKQTSGEESGGLCLTGPRKTGFRFEVDRLDTHSLYVTVDPVTVIRAA